MENVIYQSTIVVAAKGYCGEPAILFVTAETNCFLVWVNWFDGPDLIKWFRVWERNNAIEYAVEHAQFLKKNPTRYLHPAEETDESEADVMTVAGASADGAMHGKI